MLTPSQLISPSLSRFSQAVSRPKAGYQYFLNADGGSETVGGGDLGTQKINSSPISVPDQKFILNTFNRLETLINLNFTDVVSASNANLRIYFDSEININSSSGKILGVAVPNRFSTGDWFEIFINSSALKDLSNYRQYALIHEIGHALGLEHPFDASDGDYYKSTEPYKSALPNETVMSYRTPLTKNYPDFFTDSDINALSEIWGIRDKTQPVTFDYGQYSEASDICDLLLSGKSSLILGQANSESDKYSLSVKTSTWESPISINMIAKLDDSGIRIDAEQINFANPLISGSLIQGGTGADAIWGKAGWDILDGGAGNDLIRAGNGGATSSPVALALMSFMGTSDGTPLNLKRTASPILSQLNPMSLSQTGSMGEQATIQMEKRQMSSRAWIPLIKSKSSVSVPPTCPSILVPQPTASRVLASMLKVP